MIGRCGLIAFGVIGLALAGCRKAGEEKFIPPEALARQALETALTAWKDGKPRSDKLTVGKVGVEVMDTAWASGQKLSGFQIVSEEPSTGPRWFSVKLTLEKGEQTVKYAVVGKDPIWVYSEAEYKKVSGL